jgi:hypothetical protein
VDETAFTAATATSSPAFVTGIVDLTHRRVGSRGCSMSSKAARLRR